MLLKFKDDCTGKGTACSTWRELGGLTIEGIGRENLKTSIHFFELLKKAGVKTHYVSANVQDATHGGAARPGVRHGLEVICRLVATGSFIRRYGDYIRTHARPAAMWNARLKRLWRPAATAEGPEALGVMTMAQFEDMKKADAGHHQK